MDTVFDSLPSDDIEILGQIQDKLQNSPAVDALAEKYAQAMIQGIASGKEFDEIHVDISNELVQIASTALTEIKADSAIRWHGKADHCFSFIRFSICPVGDQYLCRGNL